MKRWYWDCPRTSRDRGGNWNPHRAWATRWDKHRLTRERRDARRRLRWDEQLVDAATVVLEVLALLVPHMGPWRPQVEEFTNVLRAFMRGEADANHPALWEWNAKRIWYEVGAAEERAARPGRFETGPEPGDATGLMWTITHAVSDESTMEDAAHHAVWIARRLGLKLRGGVQW